MTDFFLDEECDVGEGKSICYVLILVVAILDSPKVSTYNFDKGNHDRCR